MQNQSKVEKASTLRALLCRGLSLKELSLGVPASMSLFLGGVGLSIDLWPVADLSMVVMWQLGVGLSMELMSSVARPEC